MYGPRRQSRGISRTLSVALVVGGLLLALGGGALVVALPPHGTLVAAEPPPAAAAAAAPAPETVDDHLARGAELFEQGQWDAAVEAYAAARQLDPGSLAAQTRGAQALA